MPHLDLLQGFLYVSKLGIELLDKEIDNVKYLRTFSHPEIFY